MDHGASSSTGSGGDDLGEMMRKLGLREEDLDDVVFEDETPPLAEATRWLAIAKVHTDREYSDFWFYKNMRTAWDLAQEVKIRALDNNLYMMKFSCLGDWDKVMEGGPWTFRGHPVILAPYDGFTKPSEISLDRFKIWIQIHDLRDGFKPMIEVLAGKVGEYVSTEPVSGDFSGNFFRVRIWLDVQKPLKNHVSMIRANKRQIFLIPDWCAFCGMIGHLYTEHGDGIHPPSSLVFKDLKAAWSMRSPGRGRGRGRGLGPGHGQGRGAKEYVEEDENILSDFNGGKTHIPEDMDTDQNKKRGLSIGDPSVEGNKLALTNTASQNVGVLVNQFQSGNGVPSVPPSPPMKRDPKRVRKADEKEDDDKSIDLNLAGSNEGRRPGQ
ncbi:hypothetical protein ACQ4PT_031138 [Festuca glaucescens]